MLDQFDITGEALGPPRRIWVQPALAAQAVDCLIFLDAELYIQGVQAPTVLADLQRAGDLPAAAAVYLSQRDVLARADDFTCNHAFGCFVATDLRHWIKQTVGSFERHFLCGLSLSGLAAMFAALRHPAAFCGVLAQSPSAWWDDERLANSLTSNMRCCSRVWISVGDQELQENVLHSPVGLFQKASQRESVRRLAQKLEGVCQEVHYEEFRGGHDMACWAAELPLALQWLMQKTMSEGIGSPG